MKPAGLSMAETKKIESQVELTLDYVKAQVEDAASDNDPEKWRQRRDLMIALLLSYIPVPALLRPVARMVLTYLLNKLYERVT